MNTDVFREYMDLNKYEICRNKSALLTSFLRDLITKANNEVVGHGKRAYVKVILWLVRLYVKVIHEL